MKSRVERIAKDFSLGNFEPVFQYLSENIIWNVFGQNTFKGKRDVIAECKQTSKYFNFVKTNFITEKVISADNKVVVSGTAEFLRNGKRVNFVNAADINDLNKSGMIEKISSYCITEK